MKANEFRLGIIVSKEGKIYPMDEDDIEVLYGARDYDSLEGVPLSEEWLIKFGFEKTRYGYESRMLTIEYDFIQINTGVKIQYVHQLQNLYFALTGTELTIKE